MDTSLNVTHAWQRLRRQMLIAAEAAPRSMAAADADDFGTADPAPDSPVTLPMLYRSEAFAEDLCESHPPVAG